MGGWGKLRYWNAVSTFKDQKCPLDIVFFNRPLSKNRRHRTTFCPQLPSFPQPRRTPLYPGFLKDVVKATPCHVLKWFPDRKVIEFLEGRR